MRMQHTISESYKELMRKKQRRLFLTGQHGITQDAEEFMTQHPVVRINTEKLFKYLSQYYDKDFENDVYDDIVHALESSRTER